MLNIYYQFIILLKEEVRMRNFLVSCFTALIWIALGFTANAYTVRQLNNVPVNQNYYQNTNIYSGDLTRVEKHLFGKSYNKEDDSTRIDRIEQELFKNNYSSMNLSQRMNNILSNYRGMDYDNRYYNSYTRTGNNYYQPTTIKNRLMNSIIGQPTGYTPDITNSPYLNRFGPSYSRGYYGSNGWGYHNSFRPTMTGAGIHILD